MTILRFPSNNGSCCVTGPSAHILLAIPVAQRPLARIRFDPFAEKVRAIPPYGALQLLEDNLRNGKQIDKAVLEGPGDPLGDIEVTTEVLQQIRARYPEISLSITTLGLHGEEYSGELSGLGVSEVTLLVDAVDEDVAEKIYAWIRPDNKTVPLARAVKTLVEEQSRAVVAFTMAGCQVRIRTTVYPGVNDSHIEQIAKNMAASGAVSMTIVPYNCPHEGEEKLLESPDPDLMLLLREKAGRFLKSEIAPGKVVSIDEYTSLRSRASKERPNVAVVSSNGMEVDIHLGQAYQVLVYGPREDGLISLLGTRQVPEPGSGSGRWEELALKLPDCFALLAASAGESPRRILDQYGITLILTESEIEGAVDLLYGGGKKKGKHP